MTTGVVRRCRGCDSDLPAKHLRTQLAPPDSKWHEVRTCTLSCLLDFLEDEEDRVADGTGEVFSPPRVREGQKTVA